MPRPLPTRAYLCPDERRALACLRSNQNVEKAAARPRKTIGGVSVSGNCTAGGTRGLYAPREPSHCALPLCDSGERTPQIPVPRPMNKHVETRPDRGDAVILWCMGNNEDLGPESTCNMTVSWCLLWCCTASPAPLIQCMLE